jgi:glycosyltransferase involved in cell wall biosynthesis
MKMPSSQDLSQPLVSIALATYNGERFLREQLDSIAHQTYRNIELVAVDDASTDNTVRILTEYQNKGKLRYFVNDTSIGYVKTFEKDIRACRGELIALADQDDIWHSEKIETLVNELGNYSLICSDLSLIDEKGNLLAQSFRQYQDITVPDDSDQFRYLTLRNFVTGSASLFRREVAEKAFPFPDNVVPHDWWLAIHASLLGGIKYLERPLVCYRQHARNVVGAKRKPTPGALFKFAFSRSQRTKAYQLDRERFRFLLERRIYPTEAEASFLEDMIRYCDSFLKGRIHLETFRISVKYRDVVFSGLHGVRRSIHVLGKLIG